MPTRNVILLVVDTLRADHLGAYGYARPTSPGLDAWAAENVLFTQARSQASCTFPSVNTILTSRYPDDFYGQSDGQMGIPTTIPSLAEILAARGFDTYAVSASPIVRQTPSQFNPSGGFDRGFQVFDEKCLWADASCVVRHGIDLLEAHQRRRPFLLYLHFMDPHGPFSPPKEYQKQWATTKTGVDWVDRGDIEVMAADLYERQTPPRPESLRHLVDLYDDEIAYLDGEVARLLRRLARKGVLRDTLVVLTADHGESFYEHGHVKHCRTVYDSEAHIPLLVAGPGIAGGRRLDAPAANVDLVPTILDALGLPTGGLGFEGRSLFPLLTGSGVGPNETTVSAQGRQRGVADGRHKLIVDWKGDQPRLFDLAADPDEMVDIAAANTNVARRLRASLRQTLEAYGGGDDPQSQARAEEAQRRLKALGYLQ